MVEINGTTITMVRGDTSTYAAYNMIIAYIHLPCLYQ